MIQVLLEDLARRYGANLSYQQTYKQFGEELLEKIAARHIDSDKAKRIHELHEKVIDLEGRLNVKETELAFEMDVVATARATNVRYKEALELIRDHHPRCECMDSGGIAKEALEGK